MEITKVTLRPVSMNKVCAIASIVLDDAFVVHDLRVVNGDKGLFVAMPSRKLPNGDFRDICHPINTETRTDIQQAVLDQFRIEGGVEAFGDAVHARDDHSELPHAEDGHADVMRPGFMHAEAAHAEDDHHPGFAFD